MKYALFTYCLGFNGHLQNAVDQEVILPDLEPLYEPEPVVFSFETPAWYVLLLLVLSAFVFGMWKWYRSYRSREYRRLAVKKLEGIQWKVSSESTTLNTIQIILKQVAMATYGRTSVAALFGLEWLQFLERTGKQTPFTQFELLLAATEGTVDHDTSELQALCDTAKKWIRTHA